MCLRAALAHGTRTSYDNRRTPGHDGCGEWKNREGREGNETRNQIIQTHPLFHTKNGYSGVSFLLPPFDCYPCPAGACRQFVCQQLHVSIPLSIVAGAFQRASLSCPFLSAFFFARRPRYRSIERREGRKSGQLLEPDLWPAHWAQPAQTHHEAGAIKRSSPQQQQQQHQ